MGGRWDPAAVQFSRGCLLLSRRRGEGGSEGEHNPLPSRIVRVGIVLSQESAQQQIRATARASPDKGSIRVI